MFTYFGVGIIATSFILYKTHQFVKKAYPSYYTKLVYNTSFNIIYYYTAVELSITKLNKYLHKLNIQIFGEQINSDINPLTNTIEFIKNGNVILRSHSCGLVKDIQIFKSNNIVVDFMLYTHIETDKNTTYINKIQLSTHAPSPSLEYRRTNYKFLHIGCILDNTDDEFTISLQTSDYNYYIENAIINKQFIFFFLKEYHSLHINNTTFDNLSYILTIIDHNINRITLNSDQQMTLQKDSYIIE